MNLDPILQASLPQTLINDKPVGPTLLIGLGGTGKDVLLRLRRMIVERYGSLSRLPFLRFMHLDTDKNQTASEQYGLTSGDDPLYREVRFSNKERIDLTIAGGTGKYSDHLMHYPNIKRWFPANGNLAKLGDLHDGAGQVRIASRLGFFDASNHQKITSRLEECRRELSDAAILQKASRFGFKFETANMRVVIVSSIAGGTGGGTFIDTGFLVRRYFPEAERMGILLLPAFFVGYPGGERVRANGYAALMELNHYTFGHPFIADWDVHDTERMSPPPFTTTYLIDGTNEDGLAINSNGGELDAYRMVAEFLYQDYSVGSFAGMKRATRVNLEQFNLNVYRHNFLNEALRKDDQTHKAIVGDAFPCRFGSFGLATISFPTERVQSACASRLASRILDYWQKTLLDDPLDDLFTKFLTDESVRCAQGRYERRDGGGVLDYDDIEEALLVFDAGGGRTFDNYLWQKAQTLRVELETTPNGEKAAALRARRAELDQFFAREDSDNPDEWGIGIRHLEENMRMYADRVKKAITAKAAELSDNPQYGVNYTLSLLRELKALLRNETFRYMPWFDEQVPVWRDRTQYYANALDQLQMDISRHESELLFRSADLRHDYGKLVASDDEEDRGAFFNHFQARVGKQVAKRGRWICDEIDRFLGPDHQDGDGLLGRYYGLLVGFARVKDLLQKKEAYFAKPEKSELVISLYRDGDVDEWYRTWVGDAGSEIQTMKAVGSRILTEVFDVNGVTAALQKIQSLPPETVEDMILAKCRDYIEGSDTQPDALTLLLDASRISAHERSEKVRLAYRLAKVWAAPNRAATDYTGIPPVKAQQRPCLIGFDDLGSPQKVVQFKDLIDNARSTGDSTPTFLNIGTRNRGMIIFYNELAGIPAFYPSSVTAALGLRAAYNAFPEKEELHTDRNRFQFADLIPKQTAETRQYADALHAFVLGRVLGLVKAHALAFDGDQPVYRYSYLHSSGLITEEISLGGEAHAVDYLYRDKRPDHQTRRRYLLQKIEKTIFMLKDQKKLAVYRLLLDFYMGKVYPPVDVDSSGVPDLSMTQYSPEYAVLELAKSRLQQLIDDEDQFRIQFKAIAGRELDEVLTYADYAAALALYCKPAGKYAERPDLTMADHDRIEWRDVFALDLAKVDKNAAKEAAVLPRPVIPIATIEKTFGDRPCPNCAKPVDRRAIVCKDCKTRFAEHVACPHCLEPHVPDDLELCWKCGQQMRQEEKIDCAQCFAWSGYEDEYPCQVCGYDLKAGPAAPIVGTPILTVSATDDNGNGRDATATAVVDAPPIPAVALVQCSICYSNVEPGARCSVCESPLEVR
ncbi:MAG: hypothetical protein QOF63_3142 [Thermoanaerobaculia bacterium]|nr:hypothetical protein [Thermoanaerobaculia bacterium]